MTCPVCGEKTKVVDSRPYGCESIWRKRECLECKHRFETMEYEVEKVKGKYKKTFK